MNATRLVRKLSSLAAATTIAAMAAACGAPQATDTTSQTTEPQEPAEPATEDVSLEGFDEVKLTGMRFVPEGFGNPGMARVVPKRRVTLANQRRAQQNARADRKPLETKILVTLLWDSMREAADEDSARAIREEARTILRQTREALGEQFDDVLLQMLFTAEVWAGDEEGAIAAGADLLARYPESASARALAPWVAYFYLRAWRTDEAASVVEGWSLDSLDPNTDFLRAYVIAWVAFRGNDAELARSAIAWAAQNWKSRATQPAIERDLLLMLSRTGTSAEDAAVVFASLASEPDVQYVWFYKLYEGLDLAGYNVEAAAALDRALQIRGEQVPAEERVIIRQRQSNSFLVAHQPELAADKLIAAYKAVAQCPACAGKDTEIAEQIKRLAPHFHTTFTTTQDSAYYGPAKKLYEFYLGLNLEDAATYKSYLNQLDETKERMASNVGKHDKTTMEFSTSVRSQAVKGCYEQVLQQDPQLKGSIKLSLSIDTSGTVQGAETVPAAGEEGLAAVGACLQERARTWTFPARTKDGTTMVSRTYLLEPEGP